jgi:phytoene desaturase
MAIVIGGGFGGMAAALRLRRKGFDVELIERCDQLGGRGRRFEYQGFRHDAGPTVITAPFLFEELFELFGERLTDHVTLVELKPWYRFRFHHGETFDYGGTLDETLAEIRRISPNDVEGYLAMLEASKEIFDLGFSELSHQPFDRLQTMIREVPNLVRLKSHRTVWDFVSAHIQSDLLRRAFSIQPLLVGGNPFNTTSVYSLIHYLERAWGVHFVMGGTGALVEALAALMARQGIRVRLNATVTSLRFEGRKVTGVRLATGEELAADVVVSDADAGHLYNQMIPPGKQSLQTRLKARYGDYSMGLFVLYFGTRTPYPDVAHHTISLGQRYRSLLHDIFHKKALADDFSLYLHRPTATDPSFAPEGCESFYVLCPVPNLSAGIRWEEEGPSLRDRIVAALDATLLPGLKDTITADFFMTPEDFKEDYLSHLGAGFSLAPVLTQSAWFRYHNRAEGLENLYLVGAGTHPGAGLPGVLCSARVIERYFPDADD